MQNNFFLNCFFGLVLGFVSTASGQQHPVVEVIAPGQVVGAYESYTTESYVVIEDRLIDERPLINGVLQGTIIEKSAPLASEQIDSGNSVVLTDAQAEISASAATPALKGEQKDLHGAAIAEMTQRSAKLEAELSALKELLQKHMETAGQQQEEVVLKLAEAIKERDDARTQFEASLKEYAIRNEQVVTLAVGLREAYDRLEAKRSESGVAVEKSMAVVSELQKQIAKIESEFAKGGEAIKVAVADSNGFTKKLKLQIDELATELKSVAGGAEKQKEAFGKFGGEVKSLSGSVKTIAADLTKNASQTEKVLDRVEGVAGHLQSIQSEVGENAESVEALKKLVSTLEDRVKELEKKRGKPKPKNDE